MSVGLVYCDSGPYRHATALLDSEEAAWLPWGYARSSLAPNLKLGSGSEVDIWSVDDTRSPSSARFVVRAIVDYAAQHEGYLALTLRTVPETMPKLSEAEVLEAVRSGYLAIEGSPNEELGNASRPASAPDGATLQASSATLSLG